METAVAPKPLPPFPAEKHWLFGSGYLLRADIWKMMTFFIEKYGDIFSLSTPKARITVISTPEYARYVLQENSKNYTKSLAYDVLKVLLGNGLLTSEGEFWKKQRKLIQPAFHRRKLEEFTAMMVQCAEDVAAKYEKRASTGEYFDLLPEMSALTLQIISKAMFSSGVEEKAAAVGEEITRLNEYSIAKLNQPLRMISILSTIFNVKEHQAVKRLDKVLYEIIDKRRKEGVSRDDLLSMLLDARDEETGEAMNDLQLRDELMTIFIAGNETSSNALTWTIFLLTQNPEAEQKMIAEIDGKLDAGVQLTFESVAEFNYTRQVIEEAMRLKPPVWGIGRRSIGEDEIGGYRIRTLTNVLIPIFYFHRNPKYWEEPEKFIPERFAPEKRNQIDRFVYFPFGGGPRTCIGNHFAMLEMQIILIVLYRRFRFKIKPGFVVEQEPLITLRPKNGVQVQAVKK